MIVYILGLHAHALYVILGGYFLVVIITFLALALICLLITEVHEK